MLFNENNSLHTQILFGILHVVIVIMFVSAQPKGLSLWLQNVYMPAASV
jgi:hypothetical protein